MNKVERIGLLVVGFLLLGIAIYALLLGETSTLWQYIGGVVLFLLGVDTVYGGITGKRPWIAKIGPLP